jgi:hypothetical protein
MKEAGNGLNYQNVYNHIMLHCGGYAKKTAMGAVSELGSV